jgi:hypothetical protein
VTRAPRSLVRDEALRVLGETRCADQVLRLPVSDANELALDGTFFHEWAHYVEFSATPVGILLSSYRRRCFEALLKAVAESPLSARRASTGGGDAGAYGRYLGRLEAFNQNWLTWSADWHVVRDHSRRDVRTVELTPNGLIVELDGLDGHFKLPVGASQVFEAWAWLVETIHRFGANEDPPRAISRSPEQLIYLWPLHALAERQGTTIEDLDLYDAAVQLLPHLFTSLFYDQRVLAAEGEGVPSEFIQVGRELGARNVTIGRLYWQLVRDRRVVGVESAGALDRYLSDIRLPGLSRVLVATRAMVAATLSSYYDAIDELQERAAALGGWADITWLYVELELLRTSLFNLEAIGSHLDIALNAPLLLRHRLRPPVCALDCGSYYKWVVAAAGDPGSPAWREQRGRVMLSQQWAMYEHVLEQFAFGSHLGCYGSPAWDLPLNACHAAEACLKLKTRDGISFCVDQDWRLKVASVLAPAFDVAGETMSDADVAGIGKIAREYELKRGTRQADGANQDMQSYVAGLSVRDPGHSDPPKPE